MFKIVLIKGYSMTPTLQHGERVLVWTPLFRRQFRRGAIVTLHHLKVQVFLTEEQRVQPGFQKALAALEREPPELLIKRLAGLPGDKVRVPVAQLSPGQVATIHPHAVRCGDKFVWRIPAGHVFVRATACRAVIRSPGALSPSPTWNKSSCVVYPHSRRFHEPSCRKSPYSF